MRTIPVCSLSPRLRRWASWASIRRLIQDRTTVRSHTARPSTAVATAAMPRSCRNARLGPPCLAAAMASPRRSTTTTAASSKVWPSLASRSPSRILNVKIPSIRTSRPSGRLYDLDGARSALGQDLTNALVPAFARAAGEWPTYGALKVTMSRLKKRSVAGGAAVSGSNGRHAGRLCRRRGVAVGGKGHHGRHDGQYDKEPQSVPHLPASPLFVLASRRGPSMADNMAESHRMVGERWCQSRTGKVNLSFPAVGMALGLAAAVGPGFWIVAFVIGFIARPRFTRHVRAHRDFGDVRRWPRPGTVCAFSLVTPGSTRFDPRPSN